LISPRAENPAPPAFTIASDTPPAQALLPPSAAKTSPLAGGTPAGTGAGAGAQGAGNGHGNGNGLSGCWDAAWSQAVTRRVGRFFYYPRRAREEHVSGMVVLRMTIRRDGRLETLDIHKSSGDATLDRAAYDIMNKAQPLPRIPDRMRVDKVSVLFPLFFGADDSSQGTEGDCRS